MAQLIVAGLVINNPVIDDNVMELRFVDCMIVSLQCSRIFQSITFDQCIIMINQYRQLPLVIDATALTFKNCTIRKGTSYPLHNPHNEKWMDANSLTIINTSTVIPYLMRGLTKMDKSSITGVVYELYISNAIKPVNNTTEMIESHASWFSDNDIMVMTNGTFLREQDASRWFLYRHFMGIASYLKPYYDVFNYSIRIGQIGYPFYLLMEYLLQAFTAYNARFYRKEDLIVYRGVRLLDPFSHLDRCNDYWNEPSFMSTSLDRNIAIDRFIGSSNGILLKCLVPPVTPAPYVASASAPAPYVASAPAPAPYVASAPAPAPYVASAPAPSIAQVDHMTGQEEVHILPLKCLTNEVQEILLLPGTRWKIIDRNPLITETGNTIIEVTLQYESQSFDLTTITINPAIDLNADQQFRNDPEANITDQYYHNLIPQSTECPIPDIAAERELLNAIIRGEYTSYSGDKLQSLHRILFGCRYRVSNLIRLIHQVGPALSLSEVRHLERFWSYDWTLKIYLGTVYVVNRERFGDYLRCPITTRPYVIISDINYDGTIDLSESDATELTFDHCVINVTTWYLHYDISTLTFNQCKVTSLGDLESRYPAVTIHII